MNGGKQQSNQLHSNQIRLDSIQIQRIAKTWFRFPVIEFPVGRMQSRGRLACWCLFFSCLFRSFLHSLPPAFIARSSTLLSAGPHLPLESCSFIQFIPVISIPTPSKHNMPSRASSVKTVSNQPRFAPSKECRLPTPPAPLTDAQTSTLDALRSYIHENVAKTTSQKNWADDDCLVRYLRGRRWNLQEAKQAVQDSIVWREQYLPNDPQRSDIWIEVNTTNKETIPQKKLVNLHKLKMLGSDPKDMTMQCRTKTGTHSMRGRWN
jgi:hypothetical protein